MRIIVKVEEGEDDPSKKFNDEVAWRYPLSAVSTFSLKGKITHQRDVIITPDGGLAMRTVGARSDD
jgi:hypothetical protein